MAGEELIDSFLWVDHNVPEDLMNENQKLDLESVDKIDAELAPVALGAVSAAAHEEGFDILTKAGGTGEFDASYYRACIDL